MKVLNAISQVQKQKGRFSISFALNLKTQIRETRIKVSLRIEVLNLVKLMLKRLKLRIIQQIVNFVSHKASII